MLLYAAEDAAATVRERLEGISQAASCTLERLDIQVITVPSLRLDLPADRQKLTATVAHLRPRLLILDPFVRLHRCRENESAEVAALLAYLRDLQRQFALAVTVVHHARKGADTARAGQALRGSSEFHAWGDSNLYLRRRSERLVLTVEHRAAAALGDFGVALAAGPGLALRIHELPASTEPATGATPTVPLSDKIEASLAQAQRPLRLAENRQACRIRAARLCSIRDELDRQGRIQRTPNGYQLVDA